MILDIWDAIRARLTSEHWALVDDRSKVTNMAPPYIILDFPAPDRKAERYTNSSTTRDGWYQTELVDENSEALMWRYEKLEELLVDWRPVVPGVSMGLVTPYTAVRPMSYKDNSGRDVVSFITRWEIYAQPTV